MTKGRKANIQAASPEFMAPNTKTRPDFFKIAILMPDGSFPQAYVYPNEMRTTRDLLCRFTRLYDTGAMLKTHLIETLDKCDLPPSNATSTTLLVGHNLSLLSPINLVS